MRLARRTRFEEPAEDPAQPSLFPELPPPATHPACHPPDRIERRPDGPARDRRRLFSEDVARGGRVNEKVGRDDVDLRQRLLQHARDASDNVLFGWMRRRDSNDAYRLGVLPLARAGGRVGADRRRFAPRQRGADPVSRLPHCEE